MSVLKILIFPDPRLRSVSKPILVVDEKIKKLASDLLETMYEGKGIGLSATQVNIHKTTPYFQIGIINYARGEKPTFEFLS